MEQIPLAYRLSKAAIMILYKNTKVYFRLPDGHIDFFVIVAGDLLRDTLTSYMFIVCLDYVLRSSIDLMKENGFTDLLFNSF